MRFPWANIALVVLFAFELVTGYLGLTHNNPEWIAAMHLHRITGFAILALFIWKSRNILGSFRTRQNWTLHLETMLASTALLAGLLLVIGLGLAWSHFGPYSFLGFSGTTIHLNLALLLLPLLIWHSLRHKISFRMRYVADRRNVLRLGGLAVAGLALWQVTDRLNVLAGGPVAERRFTGSHPENGPDFPVTMWLDDRTQHIDGARWRLRVNGHVENPYELDYAELDAWRTPLTCHPRLHRRLVHHAGVAGRAYTGTAGPRQRQTRRRQHHHPLPHRLLPPLLDGRGQPGPAGQPGGRRSALARPRLPGAHGGTPQARLRLGEVGGRDNRQRHKQVLAAAATGDVRLGGGLQARQPRADQPVQISSSLYSPGCNSVYGFSNIRNPLPDIGATSYPARQALLSIKPCPGSANV